MMRLFAVLLLAPGVAHADELLLSMFEHDRLATGLRGELGTLRAASTPASRDRQNLIVR
jgi:hypothetical protein